MSIKPVVIYEEKYRKPYIPIRQSLLPDTLPYLTVGTILTRMEIRGMGTIREVNGSITEFQDIRVFTKPKA